MPIKTNRDLNSKTSKKTTKETLQKEADNTASNSRYSYENEAAKPNRFIDEQGYSSTLDATAEDVSSEISLDATKIKLIAGVVAVVLVLVVIVLIKTFSANNSDGNTIVIDTGSSEVPNPTGITNEDDSFVQGDTDYSDSDKKKAEAGLSDSAEFVKDLKGADVPVNYSVQARNYITAHVSYVAKRAIIDDGMEMYWIDVEYKKKKYRLQVPFYYFKDFEDEGICRVEIEVLDLENGGQIISYMHVIDESDGTE